MMRWFTGRRAVAALLALVLIVGAGNLWASWDEVHTFKVQQARQAEAACRQFGGLVDSIIKANADTRHAVKASKSFGQLFSVAVRKYYSQTGCSRYFVVSGG
jgi:hypothetical protein